MSNEKNMQQPERKKEHTSVLEQIRRRTGLLVGIVGLALIIFILESLLGSGASIFGGDEMMNAGTINGRKIDRNEFVMRFENQLNNYRQRNNGRDVDEATKSQVLESIWQQYIIEHVMKPQFGKIGINVGEDELYETVVVNPVQTIIQNLTDQNTGKVNEQFARPDGSLDPVKWRQAVQNVTGENEMAVRNMEDQVKNTRYFEKFRSLINNGMYVTKAEAEELFKRQHTRKSVSLVVKKFDSVSDSLYKLTDDELEKYYNDHSYLYMNPEDSRAVEYVSFDVLPSKDDVASVQKEAIRVAQELKGKSAADDSLIMQQENDNGAVIVENFDRKSMIVRDSSIFTAAPGTVFGPYNEGAYFKIYKLQSVNSVADSARVRHILVGLQDAQTQQPKRSMPQAKREADSLLTLIKEGRVKFDSLVTTFSDDMGSKSNGGDYGWFDEQESFVEPFKNAGLRGTKGNISVVETQFGYHIIEVLDVSKGRHNSYQVAQVMKLIAPSEETTQQAFAKANEFAGENNTANLFDKAVEKGKMTKRLAPNLKEGDYQVPGLDNPKELVRWAYTANKGDVSLFTMDNKFVVAKLSSIKNKGVLPLDEVRTEVMAKAIRQKKADAFLAEFQNKAGNSKSIEDAASKLSLEVLRQDNVSYTNDMIEGVGNDKVIAGAATGLGKGKISKPLSGENGVFMLAVNNEQVDPVPADYKFTQQEAERNMGGRADYEVFNALKDLADIEFHKSRID